MTPPAFGTAPAVLPLFGASAPDKPSAIFNAAQALLRFLEKGRALDARTLRGVMCEAFGASDADGAWTWKAFNYPQIASHVGGVPAAGTLNRKNRL